MSLRPILWQDVLALSAALRDIPRHLRRDAVRNALRCAEAADAWRKTHGKRHPEWGDGTLAAVCGGADRGLVPGGVAEAANLMLIFQEISYWRSEKAEKNEMKRIF
ncbi:hypothetical protein [Thalassobius sp. I31.1]|uniref:DUF7742 family protein n=1 Tax=Thalassobius sp. I31.1 TaxID=2109912 RepID=UPI000D1BB5A6|nr:hypothetical protein [Thalassobius sp. I31.1]